jgi:hypothetical protein
MKVPTSSTPNPTAVQPAITSGAGVANPANPGGLARPSVDASAGAFLALPKRTNPSSRPSGNARLPVAAEARIEFDRSTYTVPDGAKAEPGVVYPDAHGQPYKTLSYVQPGTGLSTLVTGKPSGKDMFTIHDHGSHEPLVELPLAPEAGGAGGQVIVNPKDLKAKGGAPGDFRDENGVLRNARGQRIVYQSSRSTQRPSGSGGGNGQGSSSGAGYNPGPAPYYPPGPSTQPAYQPMPAYQPPERQYAEFAQSALDRNSQRNHSYSMGRQRGMATNIDRDDHGEADCGQFAAGSHQYRGLSLDPTSGFPAPQVALVPSDMHAIHGRSGASFAASPVPPNATGVAFQSLDTGAFHYGRINRSANSGRVTGVSQTDANRHSEPGQGGTFRNYNRRGELIGQVALQPVERLRDHADFVAYCQRTYPGNGIFFFTSFTNR